MFRPHPRAPLPCFHTECKSPNELDSGPAVGGDGVKCAQCRASRGRPHHGPFPPSPTAPLQLVPFAQTRASSPARSTTQSTLNKLGESSKGASSRSGRDHTVPMVAKRDAHSTTRSLEPRAALVRIAHLRPSPLSSLLSSLLSLSLLSLSPLSFSLLSLSLSLSCVRFGIRRD